MPYLFQLLQNANTFTSIFGTQNVQITLNYSRKGAIVKTKMFKIFREVFFFLWFSVQLPQQIQHEKDVLFYKGTLEMAESSMFRSRQ